jgi:predicted ATPase/DNA-binding SARP family transcriptional activator
MKEPWRISLLGGLRATLEGQTITRFRTQKTGALLAFLALNLRRTHAREELVDRFWPDDDPESGRTSLRTALSSLRRQLEPPGVPVNSVLIADRLSVGLNPEAVRVDVPAFEDALAAAAGVRDPAHRLDLLSRAVRLYGGDLLPGYYDDWALNERERLDANFIEALRELAALLEERGDLGHALDYAHRAAAADPFMDESQEHLARLKEMVRTHQPFTRPSPSPKDAPATASRMNTARGSAATAPPAAPAEPDERKAAKAHLPLQFTRFFGREEEAAWLEQALGAPREARLITLTGPGGTGKTRLAIEAARRSEAAFDGAVWFVPLADVADARRIPDALLKALGLEPIPDRHPLDVAAGALGDRPALLVLDNFEHLTDTGVSLVQELLVRASALTCLITSRRPLSLPGEREYPVGPLPVPTHPGTPERLSEFASVQLFVDRARLVRPDFAVTERSAASVALLCQQLEGIPLALELAAARIQQFTPAQMVTQVSTRLEFLTSRRRDLPARHRALRAAILWSYEILPADLQRLFARLSVFRGGWSVAGAEAVCGVGDGAPAGGIAYALSGLRAQSLIFAEESGDEMRYRMLDTLAEFGREQLGDEAQSLRVRHAAWCLALAEDAVQRLGGPEQATWYERLEAEHNNLRAAADWFEAQPDGAQDLLRLVSAQQVFWWKRGHFDEGRERCRRALAKPGAEAPTLARANVLNAAGVLARMQGDLTEAAGYHRESLAIHREVGSQRGVAGALHNLATVMIALGDYTASRSLLEEALSVNREIGNPQWEANNLNNLGNIADDHDQHDESRTRYEEALVIHRKLGNEGGVALSLTNLGIVASKQKDFERARAAFEESLAINRRLGDQWAIALTLFNLGNLALDEGDLHDARVRFQEAMVMQREIGDRHGVANSLLSLAGHALAAGHPAARAARLLGAVERLYDETGGEVAPTTRAFIEKRTAAVRAALSEKALAGAWAAGRAMSLAEAVDFALAEVEDAAVPTGTALARL